MTATNILRAGEQSEAQIIDWLKDLRGKPFNGLSNFDVTAVFKIRAGGKTYYAAGVNIENRQQGLGTCAEEGAMAAITTAFGGKAEITEGWVMGAPRNAAHGHDVCTPCGECRQRIAHFASSDTPIHMVTLDGVVTDTMTREQLIPKAFSFRDLPQSDHVTDTAALDALPLASRITRTAPQTQAQLFDWISALRSDAKTTGEHNAVIVKLENGAYVAGTSIENAAYPAGTSATQSAVAIANALYGKQKVLDVFGYTSHVLKDKADSQPLGGDELAVLAQFADSPSLKMTMFNAQGESKSIKLSESLNLNNQRTLETPFPAAIGSLPIKGQVLS